MKTLVMGDTFETALERFGYLGIIRGIILLTIVAGFLFWLVRYKGK